MYRNAMEQLYRWKRKINKKPMIIRGARQVGKTGLMREFGRASYETTVYVNFDNNPQMQAFFSGGLWSNSVISERVYAALRDEISPERMG